MDVAPFGGGDSRALPRSPTGYGNILVVTGGRGVGKTRLCQKTVAEYRGGGLSVAGLLSPGRFEGGQKTGIYAVDLAGGETRLLASLIAGEVEGVHLSQWTFSPQVMEWGNQRLAQTGKTDLLVIDEIGPMEFEHKAGWIASFEVLNRKEYRLALVVIRPECLDAFSRWGFSFQAYEVLNPPPPSRSMP